MVTKVVNMKNSPYDVDCTRSGAAGLGNPHPIGWCSLCRRSHNRAEAILEFRKNFRNLLFGFGSKEWKEKLRGLKDKVLGCVCFPQRCHCDVYVEYLDRTGEYSDDKPSEKISLCSRNHEESKDPHRHDPTYLKLEEK